VTTALAVLALLGAVQADAPLRVERVVPLEQDPLREAPGVFFHEDFETIGDLGERFQDIGRSDGRFGMSARDPFSGKRSLEQSYLAKERMKGDPGDAGWIWRRFGDNPVGAGDRALVPHPVVVARWYHKFEAAFSEDVPPKFARLRCFTKGAWHGAYTVLYWIGGDDDHLSLERHTRAPGAHREWLPNYETTFSFRDRLHVGRWIHFEMRLALGDGARADRLQAWADGVLVCDVEKDDLAAGFREFTPNGMSWDCYWNGGSPKDQSRYFDDLVLSTQAVGPARTALRPTILLAGPAGSATEVEVGEATQRPLAPERSVDGVVVRHRAPELDVAPVWRGTAAAGETRIVPGTELRPNRLHLVRVRPAGATAWSAWHAGFATRWANGAAKTPPEGYSLGKASTP
jgi:hypothetical protein